MFHGNYATRGGCDHCGHGSLRYVAHYLHEPTGEIVSVGLTCSAKLDLPSRDRLDLIERAEGRRDDSGESDRPLRPGEDPSRRGGEGVTGEEVDLLVSALGEIRDRLDRIVIVLDQIAHPDARTVAEYGPEPDDGPTIGAMLRFDPADRDTRGGPHS